MRFLLLALLVSGCAVSQADEPKVTAQHYVPKAHDVEVMPGAFITPLDFQCGNGNTMCADDQLCFNGDCINFCGSHSCFVEIETNFNQAGICPSQDPAPETSAKRWQTLVRRRR